MIKLDQLVKVIHEAALSANQALMDENLKIIDQFFVESEFPASGANSSNEDEALNSVEKILRKQNPSSEELKAAMQSFIDAKKAHQNNTADKTPNEDPATRILRPRSAVIQYPMPSENGMIMKDVLVPLITLIPVTLSEITEIKFKTNLEIQINEENSLDISFPNISTIRKSENNQGSDSGYSSLEITVRPSDTPEGLKIVIQGYDKALKAQIPV